MNVEELKESTEHAQHSGQKGIGLTMAIVAVLLAVATLLSHRAHTEEIKLQTKVNDEWSFYQAKHGRYYEFAINSRLAALNSNGHDLAVDWEKKSKEEEEGVPARDGKPAKDGAAQIREKAEEMEKETELIARRADHYDSAELFLEISIVLCSIALLAEAKLYWRLSFISTAVGIGVAGWGWFLR